jgi:VanZ family protein
MTSDTRLNSALKLWMPSIAWGVVIFGLSTSAFTASNTSHYIDPLIRWLFPLVSGPGVEVAHALIRKCAHFSEYGVLFGLLIRGPMRERPYRALALCVMYAFLDEGHQMFVQGRTASLYDIALDSSGAVFSRFLAAAIREIV